jgi:hypothetical protein
MLSRSAELPDPSRRRHDQAQSTGNQPSTPAGDPAGDQDIGLPALEIPR